MSLKDTLKRLVGMGMSIDDAMELVTADQPVSTSPSVASADEQPTRRVGRRLTGARVAYILSEKAKRHMADRKWDPTSVMFNTQAQTFSALAKRKQPTTAKELEGLTGLVRKTIESTVYHLRNDGWIESVAINGGTTEPKAVETPAISGDTDQHILVKDLRELLDTLKTSAVAPKRRRRRARKSAK